MPLPPSLWNMLETLIKFMKTNTCLRRRTKLPTPLLTTPFHHKELEITSPGSVPLENERG